MSSKGKSIASSGKGKRKLTLEDEEEIAKQKRNRAVLQFFEDSAMEFDAVSDHDDSEFDDIEDFIDDIDVDLNVKNEPGKFESAPRVFPKEEELSGDELEKMLQDRYGSKSGYVKYAEDDYDSKRSVDRGLFQRSVAEPMIWRVKCKVGREKHAVFCLMQKFADMKELGTKLQIISAFAAEHIKGFIFIEAEKQSDVIEACNQLADVYYSLVTRVPINEASQLLVARKRHHEVKEGTWARVKSGIYRGDIAQVVAVNNDRKRATVKLIPRIDLQALASKYGAGGVSKKSKAVPPARLIPARELEEFQPHIQYRRDRDIGKVFQFLDNLMLKDGFLYKKVPFDSLSFWDVNPTEDELQKFAPPSNDASDNLEWLSQLYGEKKKDRSVNLSRGGGKGEGTSGSGGGKGEGTSVSGGGKGEVTSGSGGGKGEGTSGSGGGKGEGTSGSNEESSFEVHDLVLFGKRDFGMIVGMEKDESYKVLKNGPDGPVMMTLSHKDIKYLPLERKFTALDHRTKTISINDTVKIIDGASKGKQGVVKQIYRGVIFLYDEQDLDNAYFCTNSHMSEKVKNIDPASLGKDGGGFSGFEDAPSSPKSPLSPKRPWQMRESNSDDRRNNDDMFSVGQSLRIRVGPLKGYLCRVVAIRRAEVTVKLDSQQKVLTVKREHLAEVRGKISENTMSDNAGLSSAFKPFEDLLGTEGGSNDWLQGSSGAADGNGWNAGAASNGGGGWGAFPSSGASVQAGTSAAGWSAAVDNDSKKDDDAWLSKVDDQKNSSWGATAPGSSSQDGVWGKSDGWGKTSGASGSGSWENAKGSGAGAGASSGWGKQKAGNDSDDQKNPSWGIAAHDKAVTSSSPAGVWGKSDGSWGKTPETGGSSSWENAGGSGGTAGPGWGKQKASNDSDDQKNSSWGDVAKDQKNSSWGKTLETGGSSSWENASGSGGSAGPTGWGKQKASNDGETFKSSELVTEKASDAWGKAKGSDNPVEGAWAAKGAGAWENKNASSNESSKWQSSSATSDSQPGAWGQNSSAGGGWQKSSTGGNSNEKWSKPENASGWGGQDRASSQGGSWNNSGGSNSWDKSGGGRTNGNNGGRGQFQGGRGRGSFGRGQSSNWNKETEAGSSWSNSSGGNGDHGSDWGSKKDWKPKESSEPPAWGQKSTSGDDIGGDSWSNKNSSGDGGGWKSSGSAGGGWGTTQDDNASGGWKNNSNGGSSNSSWGKQENASDWGKGNAGGQGGSSWNNNSNSNAWGANDKSNLGKDSWDKSDSDNDQGYGGRGRGFGGRRGRDGNRGGRWESGRGRGGSFGQGQGSSWSKENEGDNDQGGYGGRGFRGGRRGRGNYGGRDQFGRGRGNSFGQGQGQSSSWSKEDQSSSWSKENQSSSWSKENHAGSSWAGAGNGNQSSDWANRKDWNSDSGSERKDWSKPRESNETSTWSSPKEGGSSWGNKGNDNQKSSWGDGGGWGKSAGGASNNNNWESAKSDDGQTSSGNKNPGDGWGKSGGSAPSSWGSDSRDAKISGNSNTGDAAWGKSAGDAGAGASNSWGSASRRDDKPGDSWNASSSSKQGMSGQGGGGWGN